MKNILLSSLAVIALTVTHAHAKIQGPFAANTKFQMKLHSVVKTEDSKLAPGLKIPQGVPTGFKKGNTYEFKIGSRGQLTGPNGVNIAYVSDAKLALLQLSYLKIPGWSLYAEKKSSGTGNFNAFIEFGAIFRKNNRGQPVAVTLTYIQADIFPKLSTKSVTFVFEKS